MVCEDKVSHEQTCENWLNHNILFLCSGCIYLCNVNYTIQVCKGSWNTNRLIWLPRKYKKHFLLTPGHIPVHLRDSLGNSWYVQVEWRGVLEGINKKQGIHRSSLVDLCL